MQVRRNNILNGIWNDFMNEVKNNEQGTSLPRKPSAKWYSYLGPGFIMAAIVFGPGSLTIASRLGAGYGYSLLWIIVIATFFMVIFVDMAIRIGLATKSSLISTIRNKWGKGVAWLIGVGIFLVCASFQAGNTVGAGLAFSEMLQTSITPWIVFFTLISISLLYFRGFYVILEKLMLVLVGVMLFSFFITLLIIQPDFRDVLSGLAPSLPEGSALLSIAMVASSFSIVGAFYQSYLVKEKKWERSQVKQAQTEGITGIAVLGLIGSIILICAGGVLHPLGMEINSASDMGLALEPLFGRSATVLFMIGLFGASFSSLIGNATVGGTLLSDALGFGSDLSNVSTRLFIMLVMLIGSIVAIWFGGIPIDLIVFAQGVTIFIVPLIGVILFMTANSKEITGDLRNNTLSKLFGLAGILLLVVLALRNAYLILN